MTERLLIGREPLNFRDHLAVHGPAPDVGPELIDAVAAAGLRGRGGSGFPTAAKLAAVALGRHPVVVVNGTEGEPLSRKDLTLLTHAPHLVLDGALAAAAAVGAREIVIAAPAAAHGALGRALAERGSGPLAHGALAERGSGPRAHGALAERGRSRARTPSVVVAESAGGYVAGEETAVLAHLEGRPARPRVKPPRPSERGLRGRPTLVQNVETLGHLALIARHGAAWFRAAGSEGRPGTTLLTVSGAVGAPGVQEAEAGDSLARIVDRAGGAREPLRALLVGGYFGAWVPADAGLALDDAALAAYGGAVGAGVVLALGRSRCPIAETARIAGYMARESAGQCGPCVHGLGALADVLACLAGGRGEPRDAARLRRWTEMVRGRGACAHPDGVARMLASATRTFAEELDDHVRHGACAACAPARELVA